MDDFLSVNTKLVLESFMSMRPDLCNNEQYICDMYDIVYCSPPT